MTCEGRTCGVRSKLGRSNRNARGHGGMPRMEFGSQAGKSGGLTDDQRRDLLDYYSALARGAYSSYGPRLQPEHGWRAERHISETERLGVDEDWYENALRDTEEAA